MMPNPLQPGPLGGMLNPLNPYYAKNMLDPLSTLNPRNPINPSYLGHDYMYRKNDALFSGRCPRCGKYEGPGHICIRCRQ